MLHIVFEFITNTVVLVAAISCIVCMLAMNYKMLADEIIEEERRKARRRSVIEAHRLYRKALKETMFKVRRNPIVIVNDTDIDWGEDKEVRF